ncbi:DNA-directed RNA polymerase subunit P [archaeon]|jgi:DNA-directed RNA polymerase subunit RPC12/RpoP|nr:DNA-directed RNA polymerase subunit P [archaeon]MBT3731220.1 DNA-directed RNA polymerase subunit P [archaeon]MBT4670026.1 DNA-directed RNA polymerase subunit P [archaeon]MBT5287772.1 DNA-directed RNA polymerase subunit P [archaeon]MBT7052777.1 DNA-directed RNA polymerase subunit P [archaeon]
MVAYKCFNCGRDVKSEYVKKKVRCPYCGGKILNKQRTKTTIIKAV